MAASPQFLKKGVRLTAQVGADYVGRLCRRVVFASLRGRYRPSGDEYKVSVTGSCFVSPILQDEVR